MKPGGIDITVGSGKSGLWYDTEASSGPNSLGLGVRIGIHWGPIWYAMPRTWDAIKTLAWDHIVQTQEKEWKIVTLPFFILPFVSIVIGTFGGYIGGKLNGWGQDSCLIPSARLSVWGRLT